MKGNGPMFLVAWVVLLAAESTMQTALFVLAAVVCLASWERTPSTEGKP